MTPKQLKADRAICDARNTGQILSREYTFQARQRWPAALKAVEELQNAIKRFLAWENDCPHDGNEWDDVTDQMARLVHAQGVDSGVIDFQIDEVERLRSQNAKLREALAEYGEHGACCSMSAGHPPEVELALCNCGFAEIESELLNQ